MIKTITGSTINGTLTAPASKSYAQRALAAALLTEGTTVLRNPSRCDDALAALEVIRQLGATVEDYEDRLIIHGGLNPKGDTLNFGEAGLGIRLFASIAALLDRSFTLTGEGSLTKRPMALIADALKAAGADCETNNGFLPISVRGPLKGGNIQLDGSLSSQVLTGLIMALPLASKDSVVQVKNLMSTPYIDMTLSAMERFGVQVIKEGYETFRITGNQHYQGAEFAIEGDWSGAAFLLVAGAIAGSVTVDELSIKSYQADKAILDAIDQTGAELKISENSVTCSMPEQPLQSFILDATHCPDLFPPLAALAAHCQGISIIKGVHRLIHKESNRAEALLNEFSKLGVRMHLHEDEMIIEGPTTLVPATVDSHHDHRMAMAATVVALPGESRVSITNAECINKSYPDFYQDMQKIGATIHE